MMLLVLLNFPFAFGFLSATTADADAEAAAGDADANGKNVINAKQNICQINLAYTRRKGEGVKGRTRKKICRVHPRIQT